MWYDVLRKQATATVILAATSALLPLTAREPMFDRRNRPSFVGER